MRIETVDPVLTVDPPTDVRRPSPCPLRATPGGRSCFGAFPSSAIRRASSDETGRATDPAVPADVACCRAAHRAGRRMERVGVIRQLEEHRRGGEGGRGGLLITGHLLL
eukprot:1194716-Prorocentrum_minimum.AAC.3